MNPGKIPFEFGRVGLAVYPLIQGREAGCAVRARLGSCEAARYGASAERIGRKDDG